MPESWESDVALGRALADLGAHLAYPSLAGLPERVRRRLESETVPARDVTIALRPYRSLRRSLALAAAALLVVAGAAAAARFALRGVEVRRTETPPTASPARLGTNLSLGTRTTLGDAAAGVRFPVLLSPALGSPDEVYVDDDPSGGRVTFLYRPRAGLPRADATGVGLLVTQFLARVDEDFVVKEAGPATRVEQIAVDGEPGYWVEGDPHTVLYLDENGEHFPEDVRLAGNVLLWQRGEVTLRIEADISRSDALALARSFERLPGTAPGAEV